jgi:uncharacterized membrane protein HdeD (DUF308 family)
MLKDTAENWWAFVFGGIFSLMLGFGVLAWPAMTVLVLLIFFGAYLMVDGISSILMAFGNRNWLWYLLGGLVSLAAGIFTFTRPGATALALLWLIGVWAVVKGIVEIIEAIQIRKEIKGEFFLILAGVISVLFGAWVIARPGAGALAVIWLISIFAFIRGFLMLGLGFRLRGMLRDLDSTTGATA